MKQFTNHHLYEDLLSQVHVMIAGATGSGKSVVINGMLTTALYRNPKQARFILIDPKRVELIEYADLPHTIAYASEPFDIVQALQKAMKITDKRYLEMQAKRIRKYDGGDLYVVIDELADLFTTMKKQVKPIIQRLAQIGRAAKVHLVVATQCPLSSILDTSIKCNFDVRVGLHTRNRQDSRNILDMAGCETLPRYGKAFYMKPEGTDLIDVPMLADKEREDLINYWIEMYAQYLIAKRA